MTRTITPPMPNRLAISGRRQPSAFPPPPPNPKPPPLRPVTSSKLLLSRSSPNRMEPPPVVGLMRAGADGCNSHAAPRLNGRKRRLAYVPPRQGGGGHRLDLGHRARHRQSARRRRGQADDQRVRRPGRDSARM